MKSKIFLFATLAALALTGCSGDQVIGPFGKAKKQPGVNAADPASFWNQLTTELGLKAKLPPPLFARAYALVQVAIFDALLKAEEDDSNALLKVANGDDRKLPANAVAAGAASEVLNYLFQADSARINEALTRQVPSTNGEDSVQIRRGLSLGRRVGKKLVKHGKNDGSDAVFTGEIPTGDCKWTGSNPVLPMCGTWKTWITTSGAEFQPEPPYPCGSEKDSIEVEQVYQASFNRTPEQIALVHKWADLPPPTIWNNYLVERVQSNNLKPLRSARAFAFLNMAMYDAFVSCWNTKYIYWVARPFQRLDGRVPPFTTVITTPNFPSYTSGHSTISRAAAVIMGDLFPAEKDFFKAEAEEAALSRFLGGIHFHHDDNQGLVVGRKIGEKTVARMHDDDDDSLLLADQ